VWSSPSPRSTHGTRPATSACGIPIEVTLSWTVTRLLRLPLLFAAPAWSLATNFHFDGGTQSVFVPTGAVDLRNGKEISGARTPSKKINSVARAWS
jgi:hypothetical protein